MPVSQKKATSWCSPLGRGDGIEQPAERTGAAGLQHGQHRNDADEDAGEQLGDLADRLPGEIVGRAMLVGRQPQRGEGDEHERGVAHQVLQFDMGAVDVERHARLPDRRQQDGGDHRGDQRQVDEAVKPRSAHARGLFLFAAEVPEIQCKEDRQHDRGGQHRLSDEMRRGPEKRHPAQEADEQRRVAERAQGAADIGDQEDEEDDDVDVVLAHGVGLNERPHQDHGGAGGADHARDGGAEQQHGRVAQRPAAEIAGDVDAARDGIEREQAAR